VPGALLRDLRKTQKATLKFQEILIDCGCGRRTVAIVFIKYVTSIHVECECGRIRDLDAAAVMRTLARGGVKGRLALRDVLPSGHAMKQKKGTK
jgi:hypothetical protein